MSSVDWTSVDHHIVCLPTIVSSTDLFDGELFGDELLDIYSNAVDGHEGDVDANEIPHLLIPEMANDAKAHDCHEIKHPGECIAHVAAAIDDGLGAFRPSTSFNDLTALFPPMGEQSAAQQTAPAPTTEIANITLKPSKKRKSTSSDSSTSSKKRAGSCGSASGSRGGRKTATKKQTAESPAVTSSSSSVAIAAAPAVAEAGLLASQVMPEAAEKIEDNTPNPLVMETAPAPAQAPPKLAVEPPATPVRSVSTETLTLTISPDSNMNSDDEECDEEFTKMAQAAVSNLIATVGKGDVVSSSTDDKVNTSSEHIKALTGNNWVQACAGATIGGIPPAPALNDPKNANNNRARRQNMSADERARQNRDRNREHARNTRLRKKAYVEELKRTLIELVAQRDSNDFEKRQSAQREMEQREVRFRVMEEFLKLRGRNETNAGRWAAILEDGFNLTIPVTAFRKMLTPCNEDVSEQVLHGVSDTMADSALFSSFLQGLGSNDSGEATTFQYKVERKNFFMDGCTGLMDWEGVTVGAVNRGADFELKLKGTMRGNFCPASNKLLSAVMTFDTGIIFSQLRKLHNSMCDSIAVEAAQAVVSNADAFLESLQMPMVSIPTAVVVPSSSSTSDSSDKGEISCDESMSDSHDFLDTIIATAAS